MLLCLASKEVDANAWSFHRILLESSSGFKLTTKPELTKQERSVRQSAHPRRALEPLFSLSLSLLLRSHHHPHSSTVDEMHYVIFYDEARLGAAVPRVGAADAASRLRVTCARSWGGRLRAERSRGSHGRSARTIWRHRDAWVA